MVAHAEINSFISKFLGLLGNGYDATLKFDGHHGEASVVLQCNLGRPLPPPQVIPYSGKSWSVRGETARTYCQV